MKKIFLALAAIATVASCSDDNLVENEGQGKTQEMTFVASVDDDASTRTTINSDKKVWWSTDDDLSILSVGNTTNSEFTLKTGAGTTQGSFEGSCPTSSTGYFAVYPYNSDNSIVSYTSSTDNNIRIRWNGMDQIAQDCYSTTVGQSTYETGFPMGTPMIAYTAAPADQSSKTVSMQFKHVCAYFKVSIGMKVRSIAISANTESDALTAQDIFVNWKNGTPEVTGNDENSNQVTLTAQGDNTALAPGDYYIAVLPGTITSGITLTFVSAEVNGEEGIYTKTSTGSVTLARNNIYDLGTFNQASWHTLAGAGTAASPYKIADIYDLQTMYSLVNYNAEAGKYRTAYYQQTADITCGTNQWIPGIGSSKYQFRGTYDGNGKKLINPRYTDGGLFGRVSGGATIKNLTIEDPTWDTSCNRTFSGLVECVYQNPDNADASVTIENCTVTGTGTKSVTMNHYGGLVGQSCGNINIENCVNSLSMDITTVNQKAWIGGIIGKINYWKPDDDTDAGVFTSAKLVTAGINKCRNKASMTANHTNSSGVAAYVGGIVGECHGWGTNKMYLKSFIYNCINDGALTTNSGPITSYIGGIVGYCYGGGGEGLDWLELKNCINNGTVTNTYGNGTNYHVGGMLDSYSYNLSHLSFLMCANTGVLSSNIYCAMVGETCVQDGSLLEQHACVAMKYCYNSYVKDDTHAGCGYLVYPEYDIDQTDHCSVSITNANIVSEINAELENNSNSYPGMLKWKVSGTGIDLTAAPEGAATEKVTNNTFAW